MTDRSLLEQCFDMLERAEGYFAAAAFRELSEPPYRHGRRVQELAKIRSLLAELQKQFSAPNRLTLPTTEELRNSLGGKPTARDS